MQSRFARYLLLGALAVGSVWVTYAYFHGTSPRIDPNANLMKQPTDMVVDKTGRDKPVQRMSSVSSAASSSSLKTQFRAADNLAKFIEQNADAAKNGNGEAARLIAMAYSECIPIGTNGENYVNSMVAITEKSDYAKQIDLTRYRNNLLHQAQRCQDLNMQPHPAYSETSKWMAIAVASGDLAAQVSAVLGSKISSISADEFRSLMTAIVSSTSPRFE